MSRLNRPPRKTVLRRLDGSVAFAVEADTRRAAIEGLIAQGVRDFPGLDLRGSNLANLDLRGVSFEGSDLSGSDLRGTRGPVILFDGCDLSGVRAEGADWRGVSLRGARILPREGLPQARFTGADMHGGRFEDAVVEGASFENASLRGARTDGAVLRGNDMRGADLTGGDHSRSRYEGNDLSGARIGTDGTAHYGVDRRDFTQGMVAIGNTYSDDTVIGRNVPAFEEDRRLTAMTRKAADIAAVGIGVAAGAGVVGAAWLGGRLDWAGMASTAADAANRTTDAAASAAAASPLGYVDWAALADGIDAVTKYHVVTAGMQESGMTIPRLLAEIPMVGQAVDYAAAHPFQTATVLVAGAVSIAVGMLKEKVRDTVRDTLRPGLRRLLESVRPLVEEVARRRDGLGDIVAAFTSEGVGGRTLLRALASTSANPGGDGAAAAFKGVADGGVQLVVCRYGHLQKALEWIARSWEGTGRLDRDVVLVRPGSPGDEAPSALKFHRDGGMTAFWPGAAGPRHRTWTVAELGRYDRRNEGPATDARRLFENAVLRDALPSMPFDFDARRGTVRFRDAGPPEVTRHLGEGRSERWSPEPEELAEAGHFRM